MFLGCFFGDNDGEYEVNRNVIGGFEVDRFIESEKKAHGLIEAFQARMRHRKAMTEPGAAESFTIQQVVVDHGFGQLGSISYDVRNQFKELFLAGYFSIDKNTLW